MSMSNNKIIEFNGKQINYERLTDDSLLKLYKNMREKQVSLYEQLLDYKDRLGIEDEQLEKLLSEFGLGLEDRLSSKTGLLSGGQRSMTAVALLFATYKVKSSPFCILDEIDAALDARNVDAFLRVLETFGDKSQFIIITHNKKTAMGASSILGVTQEEPGVSMGMSYSLSDEKDESGNEATLK